MGQLNFLVGDIEGNCAKIIRSITEACKQFKAELLVLPELAITGYPPEDLLLRPDLHQQVQAALTKICQHTHDIDVLLGYPQQTEKGIYNAAAYIREGQVLACYFKRHLPNYGVFDEKRYFIPGDSVTIIELKGIKIGLQICEDLWYTAPYAETVAAGAELIIGINASPYDMEKSQERETILQQRIAEQHCPIINVHCVGGQDELVFDGGSLAMDAQGHICQQAPYYEETLCPVDIDIESGTVQIAQQPLPAPLSELEHIYKTLVLGVKDYISKNKFNGALLGLSGGIDSALTLAIAVDALGADKVEVVLMPSRFTAQMSIDDSITMANNLGIKYHCISIEKSFEAFLTSLAPCFTNTQADKTEENIQARCRGILLMALSNKFGKLVLTTGNKSEMAVGYATLYGDMAGAFAVLKDVPKTLVFELSKYRNTLKPDIPQRIIDRPPSAELAQDQKDEDSLPPYPVLDDILARYVEQDQSTQDIIAAGFDEETVRKVLTMVDRTEYKRRQAAPGIRITRRAFGRERRYPITSGFIPSHKDMNDEKN